MFGDKSDFFVLPSIYYTHNLNIGAFVIYGCARLGFDTIAAPAVVSIAGYCAGILLAFHFAERATGSRLIANWFGFFMATDVLYNLSSGMSPIRCWHWFALFGVSLAALELSRAFSKRYLSLLILAGLVSFLIGYDFSSVVCGIGASIGVAYGKTGKDRLRTVGVITGVFLIFFLCTRP